MNIYIYIYLHICIYVRILDAKLGAKAPPALLDHSSLGAEARASKAASTKPLLNAPLTEARKIRP